MTTQLNAERMATTKCDQAIHTAALRYRLTYGWLTRAHGSELRLLPAANIACLSLPTNVAAAVVARLARMSLTYPQLVDPHHHGRVVFLVSRAFLDVRSLRLPPVALFDPYGTQVPLPPSQTRRGWMTWLVGPDRRAAIPHLAPIELALVDLGYHDPDQAEANHQRFWKPAAVSRPAGATDGATSAWSAHNPVRA